MTRRLNRVLFIQWLILLKVITGHTQSAMSKYFQMGNMGQIRASVPTMPSVPMQYPHPGLSSVLNSCQQSLSLPNLQNVPNIPNLPNFSNLPNLSQLPNLPSFPHQQLPSIQSLPNFSNLPLPPQMSSMAPMPVPVNTISPIPMPNLPFKLPCPKSSLDPSVLNNLAIALHLLILSNLLNTPESTDSKAPPCPEQPPQPPPSPPYQPPSQSPPQPQPPPNPYPQPTQSYYPPEEPYPQNPPLPPNSKFLSSSGFADASMPPSLMGQPFPPTPSQAPNPRNAHNLMSPYEAITHTPSQSYSKDIFAQYGPQNLKADFQSPYQSIMANDNTSKDLFTLF